MATTIENFIIGIGIEYDKQGEKQATNAIGSIKSKALQLAAVMGGAFGAKVLTFGAAENAAALSRLSKALGVSQESITAFGSAIQQEGGTLQESFGLLQTFTQLQDDLQKELRPELFGDLARIGVDPNLLLSIKNAENAEKAIRSTIKAIEGLNPETQRKALSVIGADSQALLLTAQKGIQNYDKVVSEATGRLRTDANLGKESERFSQELLKLQETIGSISREISMELIPPITQVITGMTGWIDANREFISSGIETTTKVIGENIKAIGIGLGVIAGAATLKGLTTTFGVVKGIGSLAKGGGKEKGLCGCDSDLGDLGGKDKGKKGKGVNKLKGKLGKLGIIGAALIGSFEAGETLGELTGEFLNRPSAIEATPTMGSKIFGPELPSNQPMRPDSMIRQNMELKQIQRSFTPTVQPANQPITINATLEVDGDVLARKTINAMEFDNTKTLSELVTSTGG